MGFALGLLAGAAKSADRILQKDIERSRLMTQKLASKRAEREEENRLKYIKDRQEADENIKRAIGRIGDRGADVFQFLMDKHGYAGALEILPEYEKNAKYFGDGSIANMLGLVARASGEAPTVDYLSSMAVPKPFKAQPVKTQPLSFLDKLTGRDPASDVERMAQRQLDLSGVPAIPEGMAQIDVVGTERPDFRLRDDYSPKAQKEFVTSQLAFVTTQLTNEGISAEQKEKLMSRKISLQDKLGVLNDVELQSAGKLLDFEKEYMRYNALALSATDPKRKTELQQKAARVLKQARAFSLGTSTKESGLKGSFLRLLANDIPKEAALKSGGYDVNKPFANVIMFDEATGKEVTISGDKATKIYNTEKLNGLVRFRSQYMADQDMLDTNGKILLREIDQDIRDLSAQLKIDPPISVKTDASDTDTDTSGAKKGDSLSVMGGKTKESRVQPVDSPARTVTDISSEIEKDMVTSSSFKNRFLRGYEQNKGKLIIAIMNSEQTKNPNATISRDVAEMIADNLYKKYTQDITAQGDTQEGPNNMPPMGMGPGNRPTSMIRLPNN